MNAIRARMLAWLVGCGLVVAAGAASWIVSGWWLTPRMPGEVQMTHGAAPVGGPFELVDHTGHSVTDRSLLGTPAILYFGWTGDGDVTPAALQTLADALARSRGVARTSTPVFVTLDPAHDTPQRLSAYLAKLSPRFVGLTGDVGRIDALARAYRLYFRRIPDPALPSGHSVEFTSHYYVVGADGRFLAIVPHQGDGIALARELEAAFH
jgi:protein SCO1/2